MRKLYTVLAAAVLAVPAMNAALLRTVDPGAQKRVDDTPLFQIPAAHAKVDISAVPELRKVQAKAPVADDILGEYECTYAGVLNGQAPSYDGVANLYVDEYGDLNLALPGSTFSFDYFAVYDEATGALKLPTISFGNLSATLALYQTAYNADGNLVSEISAVYDEDAKSFIFPEGTMVAFAQVASASGTINGYYTGAADITLVRPEGDYSFTILSDSDCNDANIFTFTLVSGADVASVKLLAMDGDYAASEAEAANLFATQGIAFAPNASIPLNLSDAEETGPFCILGAAYDADGNQVRLAQKMVDVVVHNPEHWQTIAEDYTYIDQIVCNVYSNFGHTSTCILQENIAQPGRFRIVNPYGGNQWLHDTDCNHYLTIATMGDKAMMEYSPTGLDAGDGIITFAALNYGTFDGRNIDFPAQSIAFREPLYNQPDKWSYGNSSSAVSLYLPELEIELTAVDDANEPVEGIQFFLASDALQDPQPASRAEEEESGQPELIPTSGADGKAVLVLPATVDYLDTVTITAKGEGGECNQDIKLNGAKNTFSFPVDAIVTGMAAISVETAAPVEYYNLQGMRIDSPASGQTVIRRQGTVTTKLIVK